MDRNSFLLSPAYILLTVYFWAALSGTGTAKANLKKEKKQNQAKQLSQEAIEEAIAKGRKYLSKLLSEEKNVPLYRYPLGARALYAAALLSAGEPPSSRLIKRLFSRITSLPVRRVYSASLYAIALECHFRALVHNKAPPDSNLSMPPSYKKRLAKLVNWLVAAQGPKDGCWSYEQHHMPYQCDLSNTQFAWLGLAIGARNGIPVPGFVGIRFAKEALKLQKEELKKHSVTVSYQLDLEHPGKTRKPQTISGKPAGWGYTPESTRPYFAMTAATAGNLFVAKAILGRRGRSLNRAIEQGLLWLDSHWNKLTKRHKYTGKSLTRNYYYSLWSLEKACDLGGIALFGERNWYREEARFLLKDQNKNGSWGLPKLRPIGTSFALLFLSRSASSKPVLGSTPSLLTGGEGKSNRDRVFISKLGGSLSARSFFTYFQKAENPNLLPLAREVFNGYSPDSREDLLPHLNALLDCKNKPIHRFAAAKLKLITGISKPDFAKVKTWYGTFQKIKQAERTRKVSQLAALLNKENNGKLIDHLLQAVERINARELVPDLVEKFADVSGKAQSRLNNTLCFLTGKKVRYSGNSTLLYWKKYLEAEDP